MDTGTSSSAGERISVVLPVFAETSTVTEVIDALEASCGDRLLEVLVVLAPRSPDDTVALCRERAARDEKVSVLVQRQSPGVGFAFRDGIEQARGERILLMDSDGEMDSATVPVMVARMDATGADLVVASRWARGGGVEGYEPLKLVLNRGYQLLFRLLYRTRVTDLTFGFKLARAGRLKALPLTAQFQEIGADVTLRAIRARWKVEEVPTVWRKRKEGVSTNPLKRNLRYASLAVQILRTRRDRAGGE